MNQATEIDAIVEEITIHAPATRIFDALTTAEALKKWWGKEGQYGVTECEMDLRPGGQWAMRGNSYGGRRFHVTGEYLAIEPPRLLEYTWTPDWSEGAAGSVVRWNLDERDGVTTVRVTHSGLTETARQNHRGWTQIVTWLRDYAERA